MNNGFQFVSLGEVLRQRSQFIEIDDFKSYKRCRVQLHAQGIVERDVVQGMEIKTKKQQVCRAGEFLVAEIDAKVGGFGIVPDNLDGAIVSSHYFLFGLDETVLNRYFLEFYVRTPTFMEQVRAQGTTNYAAIRPGDVLGYRIPLPPLEEQRRIVARIEELAAKIEEARGLRREAMEEVEALFEASVGTVFESLHPVEYKPLRDLTSKIGSGSTPIGGRGSYPSTGIPFIRSLNVRMRHFQWEDIAFIDKMTHDSMKGTQVRPNDVLLNITGASIGRVACAPLDLIEANVNQHVAIIRPIEVLYPRYLMYWLSQSAVQKFINEEQKGATRQGFTKAQIEAFEIPLLPLTQQHHIVTYLDNLKAKINSLKQLQAETSSELDALLPSILDKAFKGEL
jgi:type I restriction enzyme, S subunit